MTPSDIDVFSYHAYSGVSQRCAAAARRSAQHARNRPLRRVARPHRRHPPLLPRAARPVRSRQAPLAHRNRRDSLRWRSLGLHLPRQLPLPRPARPPRQRRRQGADAQHTRRQRLRPARRKHLRSPPQLLGRTSLASPDGHHRARLRHPARSRASTSTRTARRTSPAASPCSSSRTIATRRTRSISPPMRQRYTLSARTIDANDVLLNDNAALARRRRSTPRPQTRRGTRRPRPLRARNNHLPHLP